MTCLSNLFKWFMNNNEYKWHLSFYWSRLINVKYLLTILLHFYYIFKLEGSEWLFLWICELTYTCALLNPPRGFSNKTLAAPPPCETHFYAELSLY